jgi:hypothetical protein
MLSRVRKVLMQKLHEYLYFENQRIDCTDIDSDMLHGHIHIKKYFIHIYNVGSLPEEYNKIAILS